MTNLKDRSQLLRMFSWHFSETCTLVLILAVAALFPLQSAVGLEHSTVENKIEVREMQAVQYTPGGPENMFLKEVPVPEPGEQEVRIQVFATAINRADTLQRKGRYNPPAGASDILGLEAAGIIDKVGPGCPGNVVTGQRVMALLVGGGNAEYVVCRHEQIMPVPDGLSMIQAAAIPEVWLTAYQLLYMIGNLAKDETVLIHAGGSGVGTAAVQLVKQAGATPIVTAGSQEKIDFAKSLGALDGINYKEGNVADSVLQLTNGKGVDLILDCVGASMYEENVKAIGMEGRWVIFGFLGGSNINADFSKLLAKRVSVTFSTLRFRSVQYKATLVKDFSTLASPMFESGTFRPIIHSVFSLPDIVQAHTMMESNQNLGKIILNVREEEDQGKDEL